MVRRRIVVPRDAVRRGPMGAALGALKASDLAVTRLSDERWQIADGRLPDHDPDRLLALLELRNEVFEVMQLGRRFQWHRFRTRDAALAFIVRSGPETVRQRQHEVRSWAGRGVDRDA